MYIDCNWSYSSGGGQPLSYTPPDFYAGNPSEDEAIAACHIAFAVVMLWKADKKFFSSS